jgi:hypothetical protein
MSDKNLMSSLEKLAIIEKEMSNDLVPMVIETPTDELVKQAALSVSEEIDLKEFIASGCPNIQNYDKSRMAALYLAGHDSDDLIKIFPYASRGALAFLKVQEEWKRKRDEFLEDLQYRSKLMLANTKLRTVFTISSLLNAFNKNLENALLKYAASGDINVIPTEFVPKGIRDAGELVKLMKAFGDLKLNQDVNPNEQPKTAIQVNIDNNQQTQKPRVIDAMEYLLTPPTEKK